MKKGIDISAYQGNVDFKKIKAQFDFVILRLGIGDNVPGQDDKMLQTYLKGCQENNIPYGFYMVTYALNQSGNESVASEIAHTERLIQGTKPFAIFYDVEVESIEHLGKRVLTDYTDMYCSYFKNKGYNVGVYANKNWFTNFLDYKFLKEKGYLIWLAHYGVNQPSLDCDIWQYSEKGHVDGIGTNTTDMNYLYNENILNAVERHDTVNTSNNQVNVYYKAYTNEDGWLPEVKNLEDYAGYNNHAIRYLAMKVDKGTIEYRATTINGKRCGLVTGYNTDDYWNGYAGNGEPIATVEVLYKTPDDIRPVKYAKYKVNDYDWQLDLIKKNGMDGYAGSKKKIATKFQIVIE